MRKLLAHFGFCVGALSLVACSSGGADGGGSTIVVDVDQGVFDASQGVNPVVDQGGAVPDAMPLEDVSILDMGNSDLGQPQRAAHCDLLGLSETALQEGDGGFEFGDVAGAFAVNTLAGRWSLEDEWTGCDSYVFLTYFPDLRQNPGGTPWVVDQLWQSSLRELFEAGPRNVHYFFTSYEDVPAQIETRMSALRDAFNQTLDARISDVSEREFWRSRFHFVTDRVTLIEGSVGPFFRDYMRFLFTPSSVVDLGERGRAQPPLPLAFAIDRLQRWDPVGSLSPVVGQPSIFGMAAYAGHFYNHKADLSDAASRPEELKVAVLDEEVTARHLVRTVELPDAETMAGFDTFEVDIQVTCPHRNVFACSEWDRNARIQYCLDPECSEVREIVRWITPYWRRGHRRWVIDASPFLAYLRSGGSQTFRIEMGPTWERATARDARFEFIFSVSGQPKAIGIQRLYQGGGFNAEYNANHGPQEVAVPADAQRAELVVLLSGHGQDDANNCAEWCDHRHRFTVNETALDEIRSQLSIGRLRGCAEQARTGVPPGQFGNWAIARAYWCPGWPVEAMRINVTDALTGNDMQRVLYEANLAGQEPAGGNIDLSVYMVWYAE